MITLINDVIITQCYLFISYGCHAELQISAGVGGYLLGAYYMLGANHQLFMCCLYNFIK